MVQHVRNAFIDNLNDVAWMDSETKEAAKEKVTMVTRMKTRLSVKYCASSFFFGPGFLFLLYNHEQVVCNNILLYPSISDIISCRPKLCFNK